MSNKPRIAISVGDLNGVGIEIALKSHNEISKLCNPIYCINKYMLKQAANLLNIEIPNDIEVSFVDGDFDIAPGEICAKSGYYSYDSFMKGVKLAEDKQVNAIVTLPIHKEAWMLGGVKFKGHTDVLRTYFKQNAIMMLGCEKMYVALYTEHTALKNVPTLIQKDKLVNFFINLNKNLPDEKNSCIRIKSTCRR